MINHDVVEGKLNTVSLNYCIKTFVPPPLIYLVLLLICFALTKAARSKVRYVVDILNYGKYYVETIHNIPD